MQASIKSQRQAYKAQQANRTAQTATLQRRLVVRVGLAVAEENWEAADFWQEMLDESIKEKGDLT